MKTLSQLLVLGWISLIPVNADESSDALLRDALFAEEAKQDYKTAIEKYQTLLTGFDKERQIAATALYRLAEIHRKQGKQKEAANLYRRILTEFPTMETQVQMSRQNLTAMGEKVPTQNVGLQDDESKELARLKKLQSTSPDLFNSATTLEAAAKKNHLRVLSYLIKNGVDVNRGSALTKSAEYGHLSACKLLLDAGCDPNKGGNSDALLLALLEEHLSILNLLLERGADAKHVSSNLLDLIERGKSLDVFKLLIKAGCDLNYVNESANRRGYDGYLHTAIAYRRDNFIEYLLSQPINIDLASKRSGTTPLHIAVSEQNEAMAARLIKKGAQVDLRTKKDDDLKTMASTPLMIALHKKNKPIAILLLEAGAKIPEQTLRQYCQDGKQDWVKILLQHGAQPNPTQPADDPWSKNLLATALYNKHFGIAKLLIDHGAHLQEMHLPHAPPSMRKNWIPKNRYPQFAKRKGVTISIPEANWDAHLVDNDKVPNRPTQAILSTRFPSSLKIPEPIENPDSKHQTSQTPYPDLLMLADQVTCTLIRSGARTPIDIASEQLPIFQSGDILEFTDFQISDQSAADSLYDHHRSIRRSNATLYLSSCAFAEHIRRNIRFPVHISINGSKREIQLNGGLAVHDPRTNFFPWKNLSDILIMNGLHAQYGAPTVTLHRKGWKPLIVDPYESEASSFELQAGDHIEMTIPDAPKQLPAHRPLTVTAKGTHYFKEVSSRPHPPTFFQLLADLQGSRDYVKAYEQAAYGPSSSSRSEAWIKAIEKPENVARFVLLKRPVPGASLSIPYNIDLSKVTIHRLVQNKHGSIEEKTIHLDFNKQMEHWDGKISSAKKGDFPLHPSDRVELTLKQGEWTDYTPQQKDFIQAALTYNVILLGLPHETGPKRLQYTFPKWIKTRAGIIPTHREGELASLRGSKWLKHRQLVIIRGNQSFNTDASNYFPHDGDQIKRDPARRAIRQRPRPTP